MNPSKILVLRSHPQHVTKPVVIVELIVHAPVITLFVIFQSRYACFVSCDIWNLMTCGTCLCCPGGSDRGTVTNPNPAKFITDLEKRALRINILLPEPSTFCCFSVPYPVIDTLPDELFVNGLEEQRALVEDFIYKQIPAINNTRSSGIS